MRNDLQVYDIHANILSPFILRKAGLHLDDCPKSQSLDPTVNTHSIYSKEVDLQIHFGLHNIFSYFRTCKSTESKLATCDKCSKHIESVHIYDITNNAT